MNSWMPTYIEKSWGVVTVIKPNGGDVGDGGSACIGGGFIGTERSGITGGTDE